MRSGLALLVGAAACALGACVSTGIPTEPPLFAGWSRPERTDYFMARYAVMSRDVLAAADYYRRAAREEPKDAELLEDAAFTSLLALQSGEAAKLAVNASDDMLSHAPFASMARSAVDIAAGRNDQARRRLTETPRDLIDRDISRLVSVWLVPSRDFNAALAGARLANDRHILSGEGRYVEGLLLAAKGRNAEALQRFEEGWKLSARPPMGVAAHIRVAAMTGQQTRARAIVSDFRSTIGDDPAIDIAAREIDKPNADALKLSPKTGAALTLATLSNSALTKGAPELATAYLALALEMDPTLDSVRLDLAAVLEPQKRQREALGVLARVYPASPWHGQARVMSAYLLNAVDQPDNARVELATALRGSPSRGVMAQAADLYRTMGDYPAAAALYDRVVDLDRAGGAESWTVLFARAETRDKLGRTDDAVADLQRALQIQPDRPELQNYLGYLWVDRGVKVDEGLALIERALARRPNQGYIVDSLGWAYFRMGRFEDAVEQLERAAELSPADAEINDHLGDAYWRTGRQREAEFQWKRVLDLPTASQIAGRVQEKLDKGLPVSPQAQLNPAPNRNTP